MVARARIPHLLYPTNIHTFFSRTFEIYEFPSVFPPGLSFLICKVFFWFVEWLISKIVPAIFWVFLGSLGLCYVASIQDLKFTQQPCKKKAIVMPTLPRRKQNSGKWGICFKITRLLSGLAGTEVEIWYSQSPQQTASEVPNMIHMDALCKL